MSPVSPQFWIFSRYLLALGGWFVAFGIQLVLFSWLVTIVLHADPLAVGLAHVALTAPGILLLPMGGLVSDRGNPRLLLLLYHMLHAIPPLLLALLLAVGELSYPLLIVYALAAGSITAFILPTREALLPSMAGRSLPRPVALATALQFIGQMIGIAAASQADRIGPLPLLLVQATLVALGALALWRLPDPPPRSAGEPLGAWRGIAEGIALAARSEQVWPVLLLNFGLGVFFVGPFLAVLPLVVRDVYQGGAAELAEVKLAFLVGTILAAFALTGLARNLERRGLLIVLAIASGCVVLFWMALHPPFTLLVLLCFLWGMGGGVVITQSRTVLQIVAPSEQRARLMALLQLGFGGGGPVGAALIGAFASFVGLEFAVKVSAVAMAVFLAAVLALSAIWTMRTVERVADRPD